MMKRRFLAVLLAMCLLLGTAPLQARAEDIVDVTRYSYTITPILSPFAYYLYVKTDNPDPTSFQLLDEESVHYQPDDGEEFIRYDIAQTIFEDVVYEDASRYRVPGGYIFKDHSFFSDGGAFTLCQKTKHPYRPSYYTYEKTSVKIPCPPLETLYSYLLNTYTTENMSFLKRWTPFKRGWRQ